MAISISDESLVIWATREHATCTRHRAYALDCEQFDALLDRAAGQCELCGLEWQDSAWGCLHIDHEHQVGRWAVRGLLCDACNVKLQRNRRLPTTPPLQRYIANSWYVQELDQLGLTDEPLPEPGLGSWVSVFGRNWTRIFDEGHSWAHRRGSRNLYKSWAQIWHEYGPANIRVTEARTTISSYDRTRFRYPLQLRASEDRKRAKAAGV